jgi:hypothetical protein
LFRTSKERRKKTEESWVAGCIFSNQKSQVGSILKDLGMEDVGVFYGSLIYFVAIWYNL